MSINLVPVTENTACASFCIVMSSRDISLGSKCTEVNEQSVTIVRDISHEKFGGTEAVRNSHLIRVIY
jgi:hypothetical protein